MWYAYIYEEHHKAKKGRVHSRRQKGQQGARKGQQGVAPCYLHLAGPLGGDCLMQKQIVKIIGNVSEWLSYAGGALIKVADSTGSTVRTKIQTGFSQKLLCRSESNF